MSLKMGRMTKRNRAKYRRRAYEAGVFGKTAVSPTMLSRPDRLIARTPRDLDGERAA